MQEFADHVMKIHHFDIFVGTDWLVVIYFGARHTRFDILYTVWFVYWLCSGQIYAEQKLPAGFFGVKDGRITIARSMTVFGGNQIER